MSAYVLLTRDQERRGCRYGFAMDPGWENGYFFRTYPRGHAHCVCMRAICRIYFLKRCPAVGPWPAHYLVTGEYGRRLEREVSVDVVRHSYGLLRIRG